MGFIKNLLYMLSDECMLEINRLNTEYERLSAAQAEQGYVCEKMTSAYELQNAAYEKLRTAYDCQNAAYRSLFAKCEKLDEDYRALSTEYKTLDENIMTLNTVCKRLHSSYNESCADQEIALTVPGGTSVVMDYELTEEDIEKIITVIKSRWKPAEPQPGHRVLEEQYRQLSMHVGHLERQIRELREIRELRDIREAGQDVETAEPARDNLFTISMNRNKYTVSADNLDDFLARICDTVWPDRFFENIPDNNPYKKMFERYKRNLRKCVDNADREDDLEDILNSIITVVQDDLLKRIMVAVYRGIKSGKDGFEQELLVKINDYLQDNGFYTRDNIRIGCVMTDKEFEDMESIRNDSGGEKRHGEINEIELYPYYLNYIDEAGRKESVHTQGKMIVIA